VAPSATAHTRIGEIRDRAYRALEAAMPAADLDAALRCGDRLLDALPERADLPRNLVLVAFGGGKDSAYMLAFVRAMQLCLHRAHGNTFRLRGATNRHAGMPHAVMRNIDRVYRALLLDEDPDCELLLIDGDQVSSFDVDLPQRDSVVHRNRLDILMTGHRTQGDGRPTFCNACNFSVVSSFGLAASYGGGADVIITGDSQQEQRQYALWVSRLARRLEPARGSQPAASAAGAEPAGRVTTAGRAGARNGFGRLLSSIDGIARSYFADIHGPDATDLIAARRVHAEVPDRLQFFSIYSDTHYAAGRHMDLLTDLLGFEFDDLAFSFTESDCGNPALMAHLRGLRCERVFQRSYAEGLHEYAAFAFDLMRKKDFPPELVELMGGRYEGADAVTRMRGTVADYAQETFGLGEEQLVCMVWSPFAENGKALQDFLAAEHPGLADRAGDVHTMLAVDAPDDASDPRLVDELERISGLSLANLRVLYRRPVRRPAGGGTGVIDAVLEGDPHKAVIRTQHTRNGPSTFEQISGR